MAKSFANPAVEIGDDEPVSPTNAGGSPDGVAPAYLLNDGEGPSLWFMGGLLTAKARARDTDGQFGLLEFAGPRGMAAPGHEHPKESEAFYVLEGTLDLGIGETVYRDVGPGAFFYVPPSTVHEWEVTSTTAKFLCLILPGGFEHFFEELSESAKYPVPPYTDHYMPTLEDLQRVGDKYEWKAAEGPLGVPVTIPQPIGRLVT
ncbi:MAG: quercetin 2,3-dioxygenase [Solirubrobacterales bacterium]